MAKIGFHASTSGGVEKSIDRALKLGVDTFQLFLNSPRVWAYPKISDTQISIFRDKTKLHNYTDLIVHLAYLPNLATYESEKQVKSFDVISEGIRRCDILGIKSLIMHIGSHKDKGINNGIKNVINVLDKTIDLNPKVNILLETSSGSPKFVGNTFDELAKIIEKVSDPNKIAVCFDTCHVFAAGYDLAINYQEVIESFDDILGLEKIKVIHANDCKGKLGSKRDHHEHIGLGKIGIDAFSFLLNHNKLGNLPFIIETPNNVIRDDMGNLLLLRSLV